MSPADLAALHAAAFPQPWSEVEFAALLAQPGMILAAEPAGFLLARQAADEAEILTLAVAPAQRRRGVALGLIGLAADTARRCGAARLFLEVAVDNAAALALYARAGFTPLGQRRGYYRREGGAIDALVLALEL